MIFVQYKVPELITRGGHDSDCWAYFGEPYLRFHLREDARARRDGIGSLYRRHNNLVELGAAGFTAARDSRDAPACTDDFARSDHAVTTAGPTDGSNSDAAQGLLRLACCGFKLLGSDFGDLPCPSVVLELSAWTHLVRKVVGGHIDRLVTVAWRSRL